jgi:capsid protein
LTVTPRFPILRRNLEEIAMTRLKSCLMAVLVAVAPTVTVAPALAADQIYEGGDSGICATPSVLKRITGRFAYQVKHVPNLPDVAIEDFQRIHEHRYEPADENHPIARRYCGATVLLSDGSSRDIWYLIEERMGFATLLDGFGLANETRGSNVEFCVSGFDRWMVYNGACRVLR